MLRPLAPQKSSLDQAYERAGLSSWVADSPPSSKDVKGDQPQKPLASLECCVWDVQIILPFDQNPGTAQRYTELWAKAFQQVNLLLDLSDNQSVYVDVVIVEPDRIAQNPVRLSCRRFQHDIHYLNCFAI